MPGDSSSQDQYVQARRVLLDALDALQPHLDAITLVGAQAIYLCLTESDDLEVPPFTTDADLAINPDVLGPEPELVQTMQAAGFVRQQDPGIWKSIHNGFTVDLLVPEALGGTGRRAARLLGHSKNVAHKVKGLDGALVDFDRKTIAALDPTDSRRFEIAVAGPAALLVAKLFKIWERKDISRREDAKDAYDLFRLLRDIPTEELAGRFTLLYQTPTTCEEATQAHFYLVELFRDETAYGAQLLAQAVGKLASRDEKVASSVILAQDLLTALSLP